MSETSESHDLLDKHGDEVESVGVTQYHLENKLWDNSSPEQSSSVSEKCHRESSSISSDEENMYSLNSSMTESSDNGHLSIIHQRIMIHRFYQVHMQPFLRVCYCIVYRYICMHVSNSGSD